MEHITTNIRRKIVQHQLTTIQVGQSDRLVFEKIRLFSKQIQCLVEEIEYCHLTIAGGYVTYIENICNDYNDVDFFIGCGNEITCRKIYELFDNKITKKLADRKEILNFRFTRKYPFNNMVTFKLYIKYEGMKTHIEYNLIFYVIKTIFLPGDDWLNASKSLLYRFDLNVCCACFTPDMNHILRVAEIDFETPLYNDDYYNHNLFFLNNKNKRLSKYRNRLKHFGKPSSLLDKAYKICQTLDRLK